MADSSASESLTIERLNALRYLTIAGIVVLLYDATLTFSDEVRFIWRGIFRKSGTPRGITKPKIVFLAARYTMCAIGLLYLYDLIPSRNLTTDWCQGSAVFIFCIDIIIETLSCGVLLHRLFSLWEFGRLASRLILVVFFVAKVVMFSFAGAAIALTMKYISFDTIGSNRFCGATGSSRLFLGVWITCVAYDVFAFTLLLLNALSRPRSTSQRLLNILYSDGIIFFLTIFTTRSLNLIISAVAPPSLIILAIVFSASMVSTVVARSFLRLHSPQELYEGVEMSSLDLTDSRHSKKSSDTGRIYVDQTTFKSTDFMVSESEG